MSHPGAILGHVPHDVLVGRVEELNTLTAALDRAAAGSAGVVLVGGDAGVGKTRLVRELETTAARRGFTVLRGQCSELGESMPYLPLTDALWTASRDPEAGPALHAALAARPALGRLLPDGEQGPPGEAELAQQQLFGAVLGLLGELAAARPVLCVLEDLHWADDSTRHLLNYLSRVLQRERVCLVGTYRADDLHRRHPLRPVLAELVRLPSVESLHLLPFGAAELAQYLTALGGRTPSQDVLDRIFARSEGNPFYAEELFAATAVDVRLPSGLADLLLSRVERLTPPAQRVVRVASVAGRRVRDDVVRQVSGLDEATYDLAVREAVSQQLLVTDGTDGYAFRHALLAEAVYADLLPGERTRLHATFATLLAAPGRAGLGHSAAELAFHRLAGHDVAGGFTASVEAGHEAVRLAAPAEAHEHFDRALSLWDAVADAGDLAGIDRTHLTLLTARASADGGDPRRAAARLRRWRELVPAEDPAYAEVCERLAYYLSDGDCDTEAREAAHTAVRTAVSAEVRARALATLARTLVYSAGHEEVPALAEESIALARTAGSADAEASALVSLGLHTETEGRLEEAEKLFTGARAVAAQSGDLSVALRATFHCARSEYDRGELSAAARTAADGVRLTAANGLTWSTFGIDLRFLEYLVHYTAGDWDRARELGAGFPLRVGTTAQGVMSAYALFVEVGQGADSVGERLSWLARLWDEDLLVTYIGRGLAAEHALFEGDEATALGHLTAVLDGLDRSDSACIRIAAVALSIHAGRTGVSTAAADALIERARWAASNIESGPRTWLGLEGRAWLARAEACWRRAHGTDDPDVWRAVVDAFDYGFTYEVARSRLRLAESLIEHGHRDEAEGEWLRAVEAAGLLGAAPLRRALDALGRRARFGAPAGGSAGGALGGLTAREAEVLRLVAEGRNNREIATSLFISPKTASVHVSNILAKLNATSRTEAAAIAHREGLPPP
ncbi:MAG: ATPase-like protein [Actinomycetia bacterium]|nr:ATPase-like protein [Actinomycetes bacterium]